MKQSSRSTFLLVLLVVLTSIRSAWGSSTSTCESLYSQPTTFSTSSTTTTTINKPCTVPIGSNLTYDYVNVIAGGVITFEDGAGTTNFNARSILIEQGGQMVAGTPETPFGSSGGHLIIGLWGSAADTYSAISCMSPGGCYPTSPKTRVGLLCSNQGSFNPTDPCQTQPGTVGTTNNMYFEGYNSLDPNPTLTNSGMFGRKVMAVGYGGTLSFFGKKGVSNPSSTAASCSVPTPPATQSNIQNWANLSGSSWARLNANATAGTQSLLLDRVVDWAKGDQLVLGTTDWHVGSTELLTLSSDASNTSTLNLSSGTLNSHNGSAFGVPDSLSFTTQNPNTQVENRAVVGLLSRSITIQSLSSSATGTLTDFPKLSECGLTQQVSNFNADCFFGGHLMVRQGFAKVQIQGVEFHQMGQGGVLGAYPVHFHLAKDTAYTTAFVRDSSVWESNTRFITLHGTHNVELSRNVGYLSMGHGYYLEDGSEINNQLCQNLGVSARAAFQNYFLAQSPSNIEYRYVPPILESVDTPNQPVVGSDGVYPSMFWIMNAYNHFVGNQAVGTGGLGVCFWPLSSSVSGPSASKMTWASGTNTSADYAKFNHAGAYQAPFLAFRGNGCSTSAYAFMTERASLYQGFDVSFHQPSAKPAPLDVASNPYSNTPRPKVESNFMPIQYGTEGGSDICGVTGIDNKNSCLAQIMDRFTTSFNWAQINVGAVWLRPWSWVVLNSAITDQLYGGLGFVSGGSWDQVLPRQLAIVKDSIFVGSVSPSDPKAGANGPGMVSVQDCSAFDACFFPADGTWMPAGNLNPKRMLTIYDGPFFSEDNIFIRAGSSSQSVSDGSFGSIYDTTNQIALNAFSNSGNTGLNVSSYEIPNAAIGWKQTNFFYYPPAFAFKESAFDALSQRHNVLDQNKLYTKPMMKVGGAITTGDVLGLGATSVDATTILNDLDGTLNGLVASLDGKNPSNKGMQTSALSVNKFYDAPNTVEQCASVGTETNPNTFVSTVISQLSGPPGGSVWTKGSWSGAGAKGLAPAVAVYRQSYVGQDDPNCRSSESSVCSPGNSNCCSRGTYFAGAGIGQSPGLTMNTGTYYVDTNSGRLPNNSYPTNKADPATFETGNSYVLYNLYGNSGTQVTYQLYVGKSFLSGNFTWVTVDPHTQQGTGQLQVKSVSGAGNYPLQTTGCVPSASTSPMGSSTACYDSTTGVLTVTLVHDKAGYTPDLASVADACYPNNLCQINGKGNACDVNPSVNGDLKGQVGEICQYWVTRTSTEVKDTSGKVYLNDCPSGGCLGFAFTLPSGFTATPYYNGTQYVVAPQPYTALTPTLISSTLQNTGFKCPAPNDPTKKTLTLVNATSSDLMVSPGDGTCKAGATCPIPFDGTNVQAQITVQTLPSSPTQISWSSTDTASCHQVTTSDSGQTCLLTMDIDKTVTLATEYQLLIGHPVKGGAITSTIGAPPLNCGGGESSCQIYIPGNNQVTLTATGTNGNVITDWQAPGTVSCTQTEASPATCTFSVSRNLSFGAPVFGPPTPTGPTITFGKPTNGNITSTPSGNPVLNCGTLGSVCSAHFPSGLVTLTATGSSGYAISNWQAPGGISCTQTGVSPAACKFKLLSDLIFGAPSFASTPTVNSVLKLGLSVSPEQTARVGQSVTIDYEASANLAKSPLSTYIQTDGGSTILIKRHPLGVNDRTLKDRARWIPKRRHLSESAFIFVCARNQGLDVCSESVPVRIRP